MGRLRGRDLGLVALGVVGALVLVGAPAREDTEAAEERRW